MKVVISGCSGGGKSTLLGMMDANGYHVYSEPGREIVKEQLSCSGTGLPWRDVEEFSELCISRSIKNYCSADGSKYPVIFDRSYIDALSALEHVESRKASKYSDYPQKYRYHKKVYFTPPWQEIFVTDEERRHSFDESVSEYNRLLASYSSYGYEIVELPKADRNSRFKILIDSINTDWVSYKDA